MAPDTPAGPAAPDPLRTSPPHTLRAAELEALRACDYRTDPDGPSPIVAGRSAVLGVEGARLDLTVVRLADHEARAPVLERLTRWSDVEDPALERLVDVVDLGPATLGLLTPRTTGLTLDGFRAAEGDLSAGQASTVLVVLGRVLARLHHAGEAYGPLAPTRVLVDGGRPVLTLPYPESGRALPPSPTEDAYHLASLVDGLLVSPHIAGASAEDRHVVRLLGRLLVSALGDAVDRPGVGTLASSSHDLAPCQPLVVLPAPDQGDEDRSIAALRSLHGAAQPRRTPSRGLRQLRPRRGVVGAVLAVAAVTVGVLLVPPMLPSGEARSAVADDVVVGSGRTDATTRDGSATSDEDARDEEVQDEEGLPRHPATTDAGGVGTELEPVGGEDPAGAAAELTRARFDLVVDLAETGAAADDQAWSDVVVLGSAAHTQAVGVVTSLVEQGATISGLSVTVTRTEVLEQEEGAATVAVVYAVSEYAVHTARGARVVEAEADERAVLELVPAPEGGGWRVVSVVEAPAAAGTG